jgi:hypothetical protein
MAPASVARAGMARRNRAVSRSADRRVRRAAAARACAPPDAAAPRPDRLRGLAPDHARRVARRRTPRHGPRGLRFGLGLLADIGPHIRARIETQFTAGLDARLGPDFATSLGAPVQSRRGTRFSARVRARLGARRCTLDGGAHGPGGLGGGAAESLGLRHNVAKSLQALVGERGAAAGRPARPFQARRFRKRRRLGGLFVRRVQLGIGDGRSR